MEEELKCHGKVFHSLLALWALVGLDHHRIIISAHLLIYRFFCSTHKEAKIRHG